MKKSSTQGTLDFPTQSRELSVKELARVAGGTPSIPIPPPQATPSIPIPPPLQ
jgi:hypothetical protein